MPSRGELLSGTANAGLPLAAKPILADLAAARGSMTEGHWAEEPSAATSAAADSHPAALRSAARRQANWRCPVGEQRAVGQLEGVLHHPEYRAGASGRRRRLDTAEGPPPAQRSVARWQVN
mmetsp:Transcript_17888/g.53463  ORF Transcript_17888/g.53463 Transcript_17888/m.53463 type:complete len:121 (+) Transcript_17888:128-490(+)